MASTERSEAYSFSSRHRISRRKFLTGLGILLGGAYVGAMVYDKAIPRFFPSAPEAQDLEPRYLNLGFVAIEKGVNIRTSPRIPNETRFSEPDNTIQWRDIEAVNGIALNGKSVFIIENPELVDGNRTLEDYGSQWIKLQIKRRGDNNYQPYYINDSPNTWEFVNYIENFGVAEKQWNGYRYEDKIYTAQTHNIGKVIVPNDSETGVQDLMPRLWSERIREKFDLTGKLEEGEIMLPGVEVIPNGHPSVIEEMIKTQEPINVRDYPDTRYGSGDDVNIVGRIPQGTMIRKALLVPDDSFPVPFAAIKSEDIRGPLLDDFGKEFVVESGKILAIYSYYLKEVEISS